MSHRSTEWRTAAAKAHAAGKPTVDALHPVFAGMNAKNAEILAAAKAKSGDKHNHKFSMQDWQSY
jgi:hypothetical protein